MDDMTGSDETPVHGQSTDESSLNFPAGASKAAGVEMRLDFIENNGRLVIARGPGAHIGDEREIVAH